MKNLSASLVAIVSLAGVSVAFGQALPTTQPNYLQIYREEVKIGRSAEHVKVEAGWPLAYEKAKNPTPTLLSRH
jgi:hypothetical protein